MRTLGDMMVSPSKTMTLKELLNLVDAKLEFNGKEWGIYAKGHRIKINGKAYFKGWETLNDMVEALAGQRVGPNKTLVVDVPDDLVLGRI